MTRIRRGCAAAELGPLPLLLWDRDESLSCSSTPFSSQHLNLEFMGCPAVHLNCFNPTRHDCRVPPRRPCSTTATRRRICRHRGGLATARPRLILTIPPAFVGDKGLRLELNCRRATAPSPCRHHEPSRQPPGSRASPRHARDDAMQATSVWESCPQRVSGCELPCGISASRYNCYACKSWAGVGVHRRQAGGERK